MSCKTKAKAVLKECDGYTDVIDRFEIVMTPSDYLLIIKALDTCNLRNDVDKERTKRLSELFKESI